jgi:hypothetical protein
MRTFIRDGLARYDFIYEEILRTQLVILAELKKVQRLSGAELHLHVERQVLGLGQEVDEVPESYKARLQAIYRQEVFVAIAKGGRIAAALPEAPANCGDR